MATEVKSKLVLYVLNVYLRGTEEVQSPPCCNIFSSYNTLNHLKEFSLCHFHVNVQSFLPHRGLTFRGWIPEVSDQIFICACSGMCVHCIVRLFVFFALLYQVRVFKHWTAFLTFEVHDLTCGDHGVPLPWSFLGTSVSMLA